MTGMLHDSNEHDTKQHDKSVCLWQSGDRGEFLPASGSRSDIEIAHGVGAQHAEGTLPNRGVFLRNPECDSRLPSNGRFNGSARWKSSTTTGESIGFLTRSSAPGYRHRDVEKNSIRIHRFCHGRAVTPGHRSCGRAQRQMTNPSPVREWSARKAATCLASLREGRSVHFTSMGNSFPFISTR